MLREYLNSLKNKGNFSWNDISKLSGLPDATIRKVFSGETSDPRFETVVKLVTAMGGSMDELFNGSQKSEPEVNTVIAMKEMYEARIVDLKASSAEHINSLKKDKRFLTIIVCVLAAILIGALLVDLFIGSVGWIRY